MNRIEKIASKVAGKNPPDRTEEFSEVATDIEIMRKKRSPTSDGAIFLGLVRDMAVAIKRGYGEDIAKYSREMLNEFAKED